MQVAFLLSLHLNHAANQHIMPYLCARTSCMGEGAHRLLKLLCWRFFDQTRYSNRDPDVRFRGAYGTVYKAYLPSEPFEVAVKVMDMPKNIFDPSLLGDIYTEVRGRGLSCAQTVTHV